MHWRVLPPNSLEDTDSARGRSTQLEILKSCEVSRLEKTVLRGQELGSAEISNDADPDNPPMYEKSSLPRRAAYRPTIHEAPRERRFGFGQLQGGKVYEIQRIGRQA